VQTSFFISDLHLSPDRPPATEVLLRFLADTAPSAERLYVLGDLFDYWIGDDTLALPFHRTVVAGFAQLHSRGTQICFMHGNRDFLIGERFARESGMELLQDPTAVDLYGTRTLLMHGDTLCTDDVEYQRFRQMVRDPQWQAGFLAKSLEERVAMARAVRGESEQAKQDKAETIMDVAQASVEDTLRKHGYPRLIHGHTHRPARHEHAIDGHTCERWVLADWYEHRSYLACDANGCRVEKLP
jgi:UDP-2,3-diacylglucosamine hydrolase